jgi:hypothetical protein
MPRVIVICKGYKGAYESLNGSHTVDVPHWKFFAASLTVGFQRFTDITSGGWRLFSHRLGLGFAGIAYLADEDGNLRLDGSHGFLDGSEKGAVSYWQGMVFAKIVAAEVLGVRWLQHADAMEKRGDLVRLQSTIPKNTSGKLRGGKRGKRADMAGKDDQNAWHVVEAKGYSSHPGKKAFSDAKDQAGRVESIESAPPMTTSACISCLWQSPIEVILDDPPSGALEKWSIPDEVFWSSYYGPIAEHIRSSDYKQTDKRFPGFVFAPIYEVFREEIFIAPLFDLGNLPSIGLPKALIDDPSSALRIVPGLFQNGDPYRIASDGIALRGDLGAFDKYSESE